MGNQPDSRNIKPNALNRQIEGNTPTHFWEWRTVTLKEKPKFNIFKENFLFHSKIASFRNMGICAQNSISIHGI